MKAIDRLYEYFNLKNIKPTAFEKEVGLSNGYLGTQKKRNADIGESILIKIVDYCLDLSIEWLLTGHGEMLRDEHPKPAQVATIIYKSDPKDIALINLQGKQITLLEEKIAALEQTIVTHSAGLDTARCVDTSSTSGKKRTRD